MLLITLKNMRIKSESSGFKTRRLKMLLLILICTITLISCHPNHSFVDHVATSLKTIQVQRHHELNELGAKLEKLHTFEPISRVLLLTKMVTYFAMQKAFEEFN